MKKKCLSCGVQFALSGSGKRQKYCSKCARRGDGRGRGLPASKLLITKAAKIGSEADLGSLVLAQIRDQKRELVSFTTPEGNRLLFAHPAAWIERGKRFIGGSTSRS